MRIGGAISERGSDTLAIYNEYGPTEATVGCVIYRYDRRDRRKQCRPIGSPLLTTGSTAG